MLRSKPRKIPWSELAALFSGWVALSAGQRLPGFISPAEATLTGLVALGCALAPRRAHDGPAPAMTEAAAIGGALAAIAVACSVGGLVPESAVLQRLQALATGEVLGLSTLVALSLPLETRAMRWAAVPALLVAALAVYGMWPTAAVWVPGVRAFAPLSGLVTVLFFVHAATRPMPALDRARQILPGLGAAALTATLLARALLGPGLSPLVVALGMLAQTVGLTLGTGAIALDRSARFARRCASAFAGLGAGAVVLATVPAAPWLALAAGVVVMGLVWPLAETRLRPDEGRLLEACRAMQRGAPRAETLTDLAAAVLDPLRLAARNLRAPAALWVLDRAETLRVDVTGAAMPTKLSLDSEKALLGWLRARKSPVFADLLRPFVVRRAELRPVLAALDHHEALGALPLFDQGELIAVVMLPRGARSEVVSYEELRALDDAARVVEGSLARLSALDRAQQRLLRAQTQETDAIEARDALALALARANERATAPLTVLSLGSLDLTWVAYAPASRALEARIDQLADNDAPVWITAEPGLRPLALAARIHQGSARRAHALVHIDAGQWRSDELAAAIAGDGRLSPPRIGWVEQADGGTLVLSSPHALTHEARVLLAGALEDGRARRLGEREGYETRFRLIVMAHDEVAMHDWPRATFAAFEAQSVRLPPLRERREDIGSWVLLSLDRACRVQGRAALGVDPAAMTLLSAWPYEDNLDELDSAIAYAVSRCRSARITLEDLPPAMRVLSRGAGRHASDGRHDDA